MNPMRSNTLLWIGVALCTAAGALLGAWIGSQSGNGFVGAIPGLVGGFVLGVYGARKGSGN